MLTSLLAAGTSPAGAATAHAPADPPKPAPTNSNHHPPPDRPLRRRWTVALPSAPGYPLIANGRVYLNLVDGYSGEIRALDASTGKTLWRNQIAGAIAYDGAAVFVRTNDSLQRLDAETGATLW